jgi:hypothetical protein
VLGREREEGEVYMRKVDDYVTARKRESSRGWKK